MHIRDAATLLLLGMEGIAGLKSPERFAHLGTADRARLCVQLQDQCWTAARERILVTLDRHHLCQEAADAAEKERRAGTRVE